MARVHVLVEGQTEEAFVNTILMPHFSTQKVYLCARQIGKPGHHGGIGQYQRAQRDILATLKQERDTYCTTMFDYYAMPGSWPGREGAGEKPDVVEEATLTDISTTLGEGFNPGRFIPYVQMHEFEALLFSDPGVLAGGLDLPDETEIRHILEECRCPEEINDSQQTAPSKRIVRLDPSYQKVSDGIQIARKVGLETMRAKCSHSNEWIEKLEALTAD